MRESIFWAFLRTFFVTVAAVAGIIVGGILIIALIGALTGAADGEAEIKYTYTPEIVPNAEGVRKELSSDVPVILKLNINGVIGLEGVTQHAIEEQLIESRERALKERVKALLLYIDSPGGGVVDADGIYNAVKAYKERYKVPVYAFANGLCASGGLYVACAADKLYASDIALVGSVGVIMPSAINFSQLMEKIGVQSLTIYDGKGKDNLNPLRPWKPGEDANIKAAISYYYNMFVDVVAANRPQMDKNKLIEVYGASVYPAAISKEYGYVDESGVSLSKVIKELAQAIGVEDDNYQVIQFNNKSWTAMLFGHDARSLLSGKVTHQIEWPGMSSELAGQYQYLYRP